MEKGMVELFYGISNCLKRCNQKENNLTKKRAIFSNKKLDKGWIWKEIMTLDGKWTCESSKMGNYSAGELT